MAGWAEQKAVREIMIFLHAHGVGTARAVRIFKTYGHEAIQVMTEDPYRLGRDVRGIGFRTADAIAAKLGMEKTAPQRLRAGCLVRPSDRDGRGPLRLAGRRCSPASPQKLLEVEAALIEAAIAEELRRGEEVITRHGRGRDLRLPQGPARGRAGHRRPADRAGRGSPALARDRPRQGSSLGGEPDRQDALAASQREAVRLVLGSKVAVMTGGPGVGKTTLLDTHPAHPGRQGRAGCCWRLRPAAPPSA